MSNIQILRDELINDPLTRGYAGMTDQQAADDLNNPLYDAPASADSLRDYLMTNEHRGESLWGRISMIAAAQAGVTIPLDDAEAGILMTIKHVAAAHTMLEYARMGSLTPLTNAAFDSALDALAGGAQNAQAMGPAHKTAILALSQNQVSRGQQIGIGVVRLRDVTDSRA